MTLALNQQSSKNIVVRQAVRACFNALLLTGALSLGAHSAFAASFTVTSGTDTAAKTLGTAAGQTGSVSAGATLSVSGSTNAVTISGNNASLTNLGTITQTGTGRAIRDNTGVTGLIINNGSTTNSTALMQTQLGDVIQMNVANGSVVLNNYGSMISLNAPTASAAGNQAVDFNAITTGSNVIYNFATGLMQAAEADAVRPGVNGIVNNSGIIRSTTTTGSSSDGVDVQSNSGVVINNTGTGLIDGARHGVTGGPANNSVVFITTVNNGVGSIIRGNNGSGLNLDGFNALQSATVVNGGSIIGNGITGDGDGIDVDGLVNVTNTGIIRSLNAYNAPGTGLAFSEGMTVGGGTITNSGTIEGLVASGNTNAVGRGITLAGNDITSGALAGTREAIYGNAVITNQSGGLIRGQSDSGIVVEGPASGFTVTIHNNAGATIFGGGVSSSAIKTGADNDTINNAGVIDGSSSGKAIDLGAGNNTLNIIGGAASVYGDINGGSGGSNILKVDAGAGNAFSYSGSISNFNVVEIISGATTLSGNNSYVGTTRVTGGTLVLDGVNRLSASSALDLHGGTLKIINANANAQTFASLSLTANSSIDLSSLASLSFNGLGTIASDKTLTLLNWSDATSPTYAFRVAGDNTTNADFLRLVSGTSINGLAAAFSFDGTYTNVSAVPVPAAIWMLISGLGGLGSLVRRKRVMA